MLCSLSCLQALGDNRLLTGLLTIALKAGLDLAEVYEILLQGYLFSGYPRAIESFFCLDEACRALGVARVSLRPPVRLADEKTLLAQGLATAAKVHRANLEKIHNKISALCPDLGYLMIAEGYGHVLSRPGIHTQTRELAVVSSLTALSAPRQLNSHIRGAMNVGCSAAEIYEAIFTDALWSAPEKIRNALNIWEKITGGTIANSLDD